MTEGLNGYFSNILVTISRARAGIAGNDKIHLTSARRTITDTSEGSCSRIAITKICHFAN